MKKSCDLRLWKFAAPGERGPLAAMGWLKDVLRKATGGEEEDIHRRRMERMTADRDTLPDAEVAALSD